MATRRGGGVQWDSLAVSTFVLAVSFAYVVVLAVRPADCAFVTPDALSWLPDGVRVHSTPGCPLPEGTLVVQAVPGPGSTEYHLAGGQSVTVVAADHPADLGRRLLDGVWTSLFTTSLFVLCLAMMWRDPRDRAGGAALVMSAGLFGSTLVTQLGLPVSSAFEGWERWLFLMATQVVFSLVWGAALLFGILFPTPLRGVTRWWHHALIAQLPAAAFLVAAVGLARWAEPGRVGWVHAVIRAQTTVTVVTLVCLVAVMLGRMIRLREDGRDAVARQQLLWVGGTGLCSIALTLVLAIGPQMFGGAPVLNGSLMGLPGLIFVAGLGVGLARFHLFDLEWLLVKVMVATALVLMALALFPLVEVVLGLVAPEASPDAARPMGVVVLAVLVPVLHERLERAVSWAVYRDPEDRYRILSRVAGDLARRTVDFQGVADDIRRALRLPRLAIRVGGVDIQAHASGHPGPATVEGSVPVPFPVEVGSQPDGVLVAWTRGRRDRLSRNERALLQDLAGQVGVAARQVELADALQGARERLVLAREDERRALRRVLHDDLAPTVASIGLRAETARQLVAQRGAGELASGVLADIGREAATASQQLRALAYDLRPPALDERGLVEALVDCQVKLLPIVLEVDSTELGDLERGPLPAAVEVAAFRIVLAALANVQRHSEAQHCRVELRRADRALVCEVLDDGVGLPDVFRAGVGIAAMRERAAELGGTVRVEPRDGRGTRVRLDLPLEGNHG